MNQYDQDGVMSSENELDDRHEILLMQEYQDVLLTTDGVGRVLGENHPVHKLMSGASKTLDVDELELSRAVFEALPKPTKDRVRYPWVGEEPPHDIHERLIDELHGSYREGSVDTCLQIDAYKRIAGPEGHKPQDDDVLECSMEYSLGSSAFPVRVEIKEGSEKYEVLDLLESVRSKLEEDWEELTTGALKPRVPGYPQGSDDTNPADYQFEW